MVSPFKHTQQDSRIIPDIKSVTFLVSGQTFSKHPKLFKGSRTPKYTPTNNHTTLVRLLEVYQTINKAHPSVADPYQRIPKIIQFN